MNSLLTIISQIATEKGIPTELIKDNIIEAFKKVYEREKFGAMLDIKIDLDKNIVIYSRVYNVVGDDKSNTYDDYIEILLSDAKKTDPNIKEGDKYYVVFDNKEFENSLDDNFKNSLSRTIRSLNFSEVNKNTYKNWIQYKGQVIKKEVETFIAGTAIIKLDENTNGVCERDNLIPMENLIPGRSYDFYVVDVKEKCFDQSPVILSRSNKRIVEFLLDVNVPEIHDGIIKVIKIVRRAGWKTKIVVESTNPAIDPVGSVLGKGGERIKSIRGQLNNENIEIIRRSDDFQTSLIDAILPIQIFGYSLLDRKTGEDGRVYKKLTLIVPDERVTNIIGPNGVNISLLIELISNDSIAINDIDITNKTGFDNDIARGVINANDYVMIDPSKYPLRKSFGKRPEGSQLSSGQNQERRPWNPNSPSSSQQQPRQQQNNIKHLSLNDIVDEDE